MKKNVVKQVMALVLSLTMLVGCGGDMLTGETERGNTVSEGYDDGWDVEASPCGVEDAYYDVEASPCEVEDVYYDVEAEVCSVQNTQEYYAPAEDVTPEYNTEEYNAIDENGFYDVAMSPVSTFSADVDTASYANVRRMINDGYTLEQIPDGAVRTEEMVNYFSYNYRAPEEGELFGVTSTISACPWNEESQLLVLGLQTEEMGLFDTPDANVVFLIDVSGSMSDSDKLPLLQDAFEVLVENLGEDDRVSIVTYASSNDVVLEGVPGNERRTIMNAIDGLTSYGSTNGGEGIITAYALAEEYFIEGGNNRVIIATDGDLNVGITSQSDLQDLIEEKRESGIYLSVLGFGTGNYNDAGMETLADCGNGNYSYIDCLAEAEKVLSEEFTSTMVTVAEDVKLQIEFNPAMVSGYRLVGYENRMLATEDFEDDTRDAGEVGAGHSVTVIYEIIPAEEGESADADLRYQESNLSAEALESGEWMMLSVRYKEPGEEESQEVNYYIGEESYTETPSEDFIFAAAVAEFSLLMKESEYAGNGSFEHILECLEEVNMRDEYREEFVSLVEIMQTRG